MLPPAPARFSTTTDWPQASPSFCARRRATTSVAPPAAKGTTIFTGLLGQACAAASCGARARSRAARPPRNRVMFISSGSCLLWSSRQREREPRHEGEARRQRGEGFLPIAPWQELQRKEPQAPGEVRRQ